MKNKEYDPPLDPGIQHAVEILNKSGVETYESCEGGEGHAFPVPTILFHGERSEGFRVLALAMQENLSVLSIGRVWRMEDGEPTGPAWEIVFSKPIED